MKVENAGWSEVKLKLLLEKPIFKLQQFCIVGVQQIYVHERLGGGLRVVDHSRCRGGVQPGGSVRGERANFTRLVLGCIDADFCK